MTIYCPECRFVVTMDDNRCSWCGFDLTRVVQLDEDEEYEDDA